MSIVSIKGYVNKFSRVRCKNWECGVWIGSYEIEIRFVVEDSRFFVMWCGYEIRIKFVVK